MDVFIYDSLDEAFRFLGVEDGEHWSKRYPSVWMTCFLTRAGCTCLDGGTVRAKMRAALNADIAVLSDEIPLERLIIGIDIGEYGEGRWKIGFGVLLEDLKHTEAVEKHLPLTFWTHVTAVLGEVHQIDEKFGHAEEVK